LLGGCTLTKPNGEYTILGLVSGPYEVEFSASAAVGNYFTQYYNAKSSPTTADQVVVTAGSVTGGINAEMQTGGQITGRVTSASTHAALAGIGVCTDSTAGIESGPCTSTNSAGEYTLIGLASGSYKVRFGVGGEGQNYLSQYFDGKSLESEETFVPVTAGSVTTNINAEMQVGGQITGRVISAATHAAIPKILVCADGSCARTNAAGGYTISGLPSGVTTVRFARYREAGNYLSQYFDGQPSSASANSVSVMAESVTGGIDAEMLAGGQIMGRVNSAFGGAGLVGITVCAESTGSFSQVLNEELGGETECSTTSSTGDATSATSNALRVAANMPGVAAQHIRLIRIAFDAKTDDLDLYFQFVEAGTLRWSLYFRNADVGFADVLGVSLADVGGLAETAKTRCKKGHVKYKGKCARVLVPFASGSKHVKAGMVEIKVHAGIKAIKALKAGHTLHVGGELAFRSALGGPVVTRTVSTVVHEHKKSKKTHGKRGGKRKG
jgi:hypothetical protein